MYDSHEGFEQKYTKEPPSKRYRRDEDADPTNPNPSIVVHIRNMNPKATEADLLEALSPFGPVAYATCIQHSRMALVEFESIEAAKSCVSYAQTSQIMVGGQAPLFNFSTSQCIERMGFESATPNKVLVLSVLNAQYPIDADVIYQICNPQGRVLRIAVMHKPTIVQALVEFENAEVAKAAKHAMNGADIYSGCCTLKVEFAKPESVRVNRQDKDQRDYTLPNSDISNDGISRKTLISSGPPFESYYGRENQFGRDNSYGRDGPYGRESSFGRDSQYGRDGSYGGYDRGGYRGGRGSQGYMSRGPPHRELYPERGGPSYDRYDDHHDRGRYDNDRSLGGGPGCVMMIYGLDHEKVNCDMLFNILCQYGNVLRISFMRSKTETGMIEMGTPEERSNVLDHLQGFEMFGLTFEFKPSHQECVHSMRDPFLLPDGSPSFKDFTSSRNQRFSTPEFAAKNRIIFPTHVLHWFNAPGTMDKEALEKLLEEKTPHKATNIVVFPSKNERSAAGIVEFESVSIANEVLALANHSPVESPYGSAPFIVKWAYATPKRWDGSNDQPKQNESENDDTRITEEGDQPNNERIKPAYRPRYRDTEREGGYRGRGSYRGNPRGGGRGGYDDRFRKRRNFNE